MTHRVVIQPAAQAAIEATYERHRERAPVGAAKWYNGLVKAIRSLESHPERCGLAPESAFFDVEIRQLLYGKRDRVYRILFTIHGDEVSVLYFRHRAQDLVRPEEESAE